MMHIQWVDGCITPNWPLLGCSSNMYYWWNLQIYLYDGWRCLPSNKKCCMLAIGSSSSSCWVTTVNSLLLIFVTICWAPTRVLDSHTHKTENYKSWPILTTSHHYTVLRYLGVSWDLQHVNSVAMNKDHRFQILILFCDILFYILGKWLYFLSLMIS